MKSIERRLQELEDDSAIRRYSGEVDQAIPWQTDQPISWRRGMKNAVDG